MSGHLVVLTLLREEYLEDVILALTETGAGGAVVADAVNMQRMMATDMPIFAGFREELTEQPGFAKVVMATAPGADYLEHFCAALAASGTDFVRERLGRMILLPVVSAIGPEGEA